MCTYIMTNDNFGDEIKNTLDDSILHIKYDHEYPVDFLITSNDCERKILIFILNMSHFSNTEFGLNNRRAVYYSMLKNIPLIILVDPENCDLIYQLEPSKEEIFMESEKISENGYIICDFNKFEDKFVYGPETNNIHIYINNIESEIKKIPDFIKRANQREKLCVILNEYFGQ